MSGPPGMTPTLSNTARPAENRTWNPMGTAALAHDMRVHPDIVRRLIASTATITGRRRSDVRALLRERVGLGETPDQIEAYLRATFHSDPTGVTAVRHVNRERGF